VLELGPGKGSWTRAILAHIPDGELHTVDFQDVTKWINASSYGARLVCHLVDDFSLAAVPDGYFDVCFSFGVLCHHAIEQIRQILDASRSKMARGGIAVHQYAETHKFYRSGRGVDFPGLASLPDSWWPPNTVEAMTATAEDAGWTVIEGDMRLFDRDGIILLKASY
jgi:cyclopropane fatty-acyl-phospholipid synthase-like methyltransferase